MVLQKTRFPAVASTPDHGGVTTRCSHLISPVSATIAISRPQFSSGRNRAPPPPPPPAYISPGRNSTASDLKKRRRSSRISTYSIFVLGLTRRHPVSRAIHAGPYRVVTLDGRLGVRQ